MEELKVFNEQEVLGKDFKMYGDFENPYFLAKDVALWIEHKQVSRMIELVDDEEKTKVCFKSTSSRSTQEQWFLSEDGLYEVLMQSKKPIARQFKKKVKEILKSVRQNGAYMTENTLEKAIQNPDFMIGLLTNLKEEKEKRKSAELEVGRKQDVIEGLVDDIPLAEKRARLNSIIRYGVVSKYQERYRLLYTEFNKVHHMDIQTRFKNGKARKEIKPNYSSTLDYVDRKLNMIPEMYDIACKLFESDVEKLVEEWKSVLVREIV